MIAQLSRLHKPTLFVLIGGGVMLIGLVLQLLLVNAGVSEVPAYTIQLIFTVVLNYDLNRAITWRDREHSVHAAVKFFGSRALTLAASWLLFVTLVNGLGINHLAANGLSVFIAMFLNYTLSDRWAFVPSPENMAWMTRWAQIHPVRTVLKRAFLLVKPTVAVLLVVLYWQPILIAVAVFIVLFTLVQGSLQIYWMTYTQRNERAMDETRFVSADTYDGPMLKFSLIFPAVNEGVVLVQSIREALSTGYPIDLIEIAVTLRHNQQETIDLVEALRREYPDTIRLFVNEFAASEKKSAQMNAVLPHLTGDVLSVLDAESKFQPGQLAAVNATINIRGIDVFQGGVQLTNLENTMSGSWPMRLWRFITREWYVPHNSLEYRSWFSSRMFYQMAQGVVTLGGNTVFKPVNLMREVGGWNDKRLTEDADLGIKLSVDHDVKFGAAYEARYATREHTPPRLFGSGSLFKQRVRWDQGFWQVLRDRRWLRLPTLKQRLLALYVLATPQLQTASALYIIGGLSLALTGILIPSAPKLPLIVTMALSLPAVPMLVIMLLQLIDLPAFCRDFGHKLKARYFVSLVVGFLPYQIILGAAAVTSVIRQALGNESWSLTARNVEAHMSVPSHSLAIAVE